MYIHVHRCVLFSNKHAHISTRVYVCERAHTDTRTAHTYACMHIHMHINMHTHVHGHIYVHEYIQMHTHNREEGEQSNK